MTGERQKGWQHHLAGRLRTLAGNTLRRRVIVHYHLFKNAGSSFDHILATNFGSRWSRVEGAEPWSVLGAQELATFIETNPRLLAVSSHTARLPLPALSGITLYPVFFLRHPIDRVESIYQFERRRGGDTFSAHTAARYDLPGYVERMLDEPGNNGVVLRNFQTLCLSTAAADCRDIRETQSRPEHLEEAQALLGSLPAFGLVERFDDSLRLIENWLRPDYPGLRLFSAHVNRGNERPDLPGERLAGIEARLGPVLMRRIMEANTLDMALFRFAQQRFTELTR